MIKGIDVSSHNGNIEWFKVAQQVDFAIIRGGYGFSTIDNKALYNIREAAKNNLKVGMYWFSYACSVKDAIKEANFVIELIEKNKLNVELGVWFDWEYASDDYAKKKGVTVNRALFSDMAKAFCITLKNAGYISGVYVNKDYLNRYCDSEIKNNYPLWIADWRGEAYKPTGDNVKFWQYGAETNKIDSKNINGIQGVVDKDYMLYIEKETPKDEEEVKANCDCIKGDMDGDGKVTSYDALKILQEIVGK